MARRVANIIYKAKLAALRKHLATVQGKSVNMRKNLEKLNDQLTSGALFKKVERRVNAAGAMSNIMRLRFLQGRRHAGHGRKWKALSEPYASKYRKFKGAPILIQSGTLVNIASRIVWDTFSMTKLPEWESIEVPLVYAEYQNEMRPFMENPSIQELQPALKMARAFLDQEINRILKG